MDAVTVDLLYTMILCLSLILLSMMALRALPHSPKQILADAAAWDRVGRQLRSAFDPAIQGRMVPAEE